MSKLEDLQIRVLEKVSLNCADIEAVFGDYIDGDLTQSLRARIDAHLSKCSDCEAFASQYRQVVELASELKPKFVEAKEMPAGVSGRLREALNRRLGLALSL